MPWGVAYPEEAMPSLSLKKSIWSDDRFVWGGLAFIFGLFITWGLPLWNEDYSQWQVLAGQGWLDLFFQTLSPVLKGPVAYGYSDRPLTVLLYKLSFSVFGEKALPLYVLKCAGLGLLAAGLANLASKLKISPWVTGWGLAALLLSPGVVASLIQLSDLSVVVGALEGALALWAIKQVASHRSWKSWGLQFFAAVYVGARLRGDLRLVALALLLWVLIDARYRKAPLVTVFAASFLLSFPWDAGLMRPTFLAGRSGVRDLEFLACLIGPPHRCHLGPGSFDRSACAGFFRPCWACSSSFWLCCFGVWRWLQAALGAFVRS